MRFCVDYRYLIQATVGYIYPLPRIDDWIDILGDSSVFSTLDANCGYCQIPIAPEYRHKTCFTTHMGTYKYKRIPFGLMNAPETFQRALYIIISGVRWHIFLIHLEDLIFFSPSMYSHVGYMERILGLLQESGVTLKFINCSFFKTKSITLVIQYCRENSQRR